MLWHIEEGRVKHDEHENVAAERCNQPDPQQRSRDALPYDLA